MVTIGILFCFSCCCHCLAPSEKHRKIVILLLQLLLPHYPAPAAAATAKLQASATLNPWPHGFATPKHHLISCRNDVEKCTAKMSNVISESLEKTSKNRQNQYTVFFCSSCCCHCQAPFFCSSCCYHIILLQLLLPLPSSKLQLRTSPHTSFVPKGQAPDFSSQPLATRLRHTKTPPNFVPKRRPKMHGKNV